MEKKFGSSVMEDMMVVLKTVTRERNAYLEERGYLEPSSKVEETRAAGDSPSAVRLNKLRAEENSLAERLIVIQTSREKLRSKYEALKENETRIDALEYEQRASTNKKKVDDLRALQRRQSQEHVLEQAKARLDALVSISVYNVAFFIWHDGPFGTINGFRLGRCPSILTEWSEVNMAWGQTALLLATIAHKLSFTFSKFRIIPMGSASRIAKTGRERSSYDLHSKNGGGSIFSRSTFNAGMGSFLFCLDEICKYVTELDPSFLLPHAIDNENITVGGLPIKISGGSSDAWTRALKCMLGDLKWLLAYINKNIK